MRYEHCQISPALHKKNPGPTLDRKTRLYRTSIRYQQERGSYIERLPFLYDTVTRRIENIEGYFEE